MRGFLNRQTGRQVCSKPVGSVPVPPGKTLVLPEELLDVCHHVHALIRSDQAFIEDLEKRIRAGTNTEYFARKYQDKNAGGGCCSGSVDYNDDVDRQRMIQNVIQAETSKVQGLPGAKGPTRQQMEELVENFHPKDIPCCQPVKFQYVENDTVGEVLDRCIGSVNQDMLATVLEVMEVAEKSYRKVLEGIEKDADEQEAKRDEQEEPVQLSEDNDFMKRLNESDNPMMKQFSQMLGQGPQKVVRAPMKGSPEDKFSRQMVLKESLIMVLKKKVLSELTRKHKMDARTGGLTATPGGWTICPLDFLNQTVLSTLFKSDNDKTKVVTAACVPNFMVTPPAVMADLKRMDNDGILRIIGRTTRIRKAWIALESFKQSEFPALTQFMLRFGSLPFEINKKCGFHLQIPSDFLVERTYLHPNSSTTEMGSQDMDDVFRPKRRLECGSHPGMDNGRVLAAVFCLEEPKIPSKLVLCLNDEAAVDQEFELKKDHVILYHTRDMVSRVEHSEDVDGTPQDGVSTTMTLFLRGVLN